MTSMRLPLPRSIVLLEPLEPGMLMPVGKEEEEALDLDAGAIRQQFFEPSRTEVRGTLHQHVSLVKALVAW